MTIKLDLSDIKIPKTVAGVKVPKRLRKRGKKLIAKAQTPAGQQAIATGLTIVGAAIAAGVRSRSADRSATADAPRRPGEAGTAPGSDLGEAVTAGIGALQRFLVGTRRA